MTSTSNSGGVWLRPISVDDASAITRLLAGDTELALQTATIPIPYTIDTAHNFLSRADPNQIFSIIAQDELVGAIGMKECEPVEIGYWIGRVHWRRGYATAAVALLMKEARCRGIIRLAAEVFPDNTASMHVLEKSGFISQGEVWRDLPERGGLRRLIRFEVNNLAG